MTLSRRHFVGFGTLLSAGASLGFVGLQRRRAAEAQAFPALIADPQGIVDLPPGFTYRVLQKSGDPLSDGGVVRAVPDGMAAFAGAPGQVVLMRNHELIAPSGGVSRLVVDLATLSVLSSNDVLVGTSRNCAGGPSPWGWLTCEEVPNGRVWLCPIHAESVLVDGERKAIDAYGTFRHEAVCIDPDGFAAYLTEDDYNGHLYRMVPNDPATDPFTGPLQALKVVGRDHFDTSAMALDESVEVEWVDVEPSAAPADATAQYAAIVRRAEGVWWFDGAVYFTATSNNQLFELVPSPTGGTLRLIARDFIGPDNITVAPWGDLFVAEDQSGVCRIRIVDVAGNVRDFARNAFSSGQEFAGVCFSPDGKVLFVNMQWSGHTLAISGPFNERIPPLEDAGAPVDPGAPAVDAGDDAGDAGSGAADAGDDPGDTPRAQDSGAHAADAGMHKDGGAGRPNDPGGCTVAAEPLTRAHALLTSVIAGVLAWRRRGRNAARDAGDC